MNLENLFKKSRLTVIAGQSKSTKLTFCLYALSEFLNNASITVVSPTNPSRMLAKLKISEESINNFANLSERLTFHFFKNNWSELKANYGLELFEQDLGQLFKSSDDKFILFHLFHRFFDVPDRRYIEPFIEVITRLAIEHDKQVFFTCNTESENYQYISQNLNVHADLLLQTVATKNATIKAVNVDYSVYPIEEFNYHFKLSNGDLSLTPAVQALGVDNAKELSVQQKTKSVKKSVLLLSNDDNIINLHQYLLGGQEKIKLNVCRNLSEALAALLEKPTVIINHCDDIEEHYGLSNALQENHVNSSLIFLIKKAYVREEDRIKASELYNCNQIFDMSFRLLDYVLTLEKELDQRFYSRLMDKEKRASYFNQQSAFDNYLSELKSKRIFYCVHQFNKMVSQPENIKVLLRDNDAIHFNDAANDGTAWLVCVNSQKEDAKAILQKVHSISKDAVLVNSYNLLEKIPQVAEESVA